MSESTKQILKYLGDFEFEFDLSYQIDQIILKYGDWEPHVRFYLQKFIKPGSSVVDVGANAGYLTLPMANLVGDQGKVFAFEPNSQTRTRLLRNLDLNPLLKSRVIVSAAGLGAESSHFYVSPDSRPESLGNAALISEDQSGMLEKIKVEQLDKLISEPISLIKIDVEGMELKVLEGSRSQLETNHPVIIFETLRTESADNHKKVEDFLRQFGYRLYCPTPDLKSLIEISYPNYPFDDTVALQSS